MVFNDDQKDWMNYLSKMRVKWQLWRGKPMSERGLLSRVTHRGLLFLLWPYYRRMPEWLHAYGPHRAFVLLCDNLRHVMEVELPSARKIEGMALKEAAGERRLRIHAEMRLLGVDEETMKSINAAFGTDFPTSRMD